MRGIKIPWLSDFAYNIVRRRHHRRIKHGKRDVQVVNFGEERDYDKGEKEIYKPVL